MCANFGPAPDMDAYRDRYRLDGADFQGVSGWCSARVTY